MKQITLREARYKAKLTQDELAAKSGVDQTTISQLEVGRAANPSFATVMRLSSVLGIDPRALKFGQREAVAS